MTSPSMARTVALTSSAPVLRLRCLAAARISDQTRRTAAASIDAGAAGGRRRAAPERGGRRETGAASAAGRALDDTRCSPIRRSGRLLGRRLLRNHGRRRCGAVDGLPRRPAQARTPPPRPHPTAPAQGGGRRLSRRRRHRDRGLPGSGAGRDLRSIPLVRRPGHSPAPREGAPRRGRLRVAGLRGGAAGLPGATGAAAIDARRSIRSSRCSSGPRRRAAGQQHSRTHQLQQQPRRRRAAHLDEAGVQVSAVAGQRRRAEPLRLPAPWLELVRRRVDQAGAPRPAACGSDQVPEALEQVGGEPARVVAGLHHPVHAPNTAAPVTGRQRIDDLVQQCGVCDAEQRHRAP